LHLHGRVSRAGEHAADPGRRPVRIQHVTLATADLEPMIEFYLTLGFRLSDRMGKVFAWLRSDVEHHSVAIVDTGSSGGLDHYSFDLDSWDDFKVWADRLTDRAIPVQWGPGRHGPGNNLFLFFDDLDGNHIELSAEMERFFDGRADYTPRIWNADPTTVNLWGGQVPQWRNVAHQTPAA
jgi:catechol-2,3-dioxygenase